MPISLAPGVSLPTEAVTQTFAILGKRGSGKTTTALVLTEGLLDANQQVVVIDPLDVTWGLRSSRSGREPGYPVIVLGGDHADLPLEATAGALLADVVVEHRSSLVLSLRHFSMNEQRRFVTDFCERLYTLKGKNEHRTPLHLILDEADEFAPQRLPPGGERMFGAIDRIVRRGRSSGLGVTLISQRSAVLAKDVLSQAEVLICHQTISPQDRKALEAWIEAHDAHDQRRTFMESLASLARGEAWVWSPGWLDLFKRVQIRDRKTFDSSSTPKAGTKRATPTAHALIDLDRLRERMAETLERAKAEDPRELRKQIAELKRQLAAKPAPERAPVRERVVEKLVLTDKQLQRIERALDRLDRLRASAAEEGQTLAALRTEIVQAVTRIGREPVPTRTPLPQIPPAIKIPTRAPLPRRVNGTGALPKGEHLTLTAIAQCGENGVTREQLTVLTGYKRSSRDAYIQRLRERDLVKSDGTRIWVTVEGIGKLGPDFEPLPTGPALRDWWSSRLPEGERRVLDVLVDAFPRAVTREQIDAATGYKRSSRDAYLQRLGARQLVEPFGRGEVRASETLFDMRV